MSRGAAGKTTPVKVTAAVKAAQAIDLRRQGATYDQIAAEVGYGTKAAAHNAVTRALAKAIAVPAADLRSLEADRLDMLQRAHWPKAIDGDLEATAAVLRVMTRRARLLGLDQPVDVRVRLDEDQITYMETVIRRLLDGISSAFTAAGLDEALAQAWPVVLGEVVPRELTALAEQGAA